MQVNGLFAFEGFGEDAQGALDVPLDRMQGDVEPFGYFPVLQPLEPAEEKHFAAAFGQRVHDALYLLFQLLIQVGMPVFGEGEIVVVKTLLPDFRPGQAADRVFVDDAFVLQVIEASVAGHGEQQHAGLFGVEGGLPVPQRHEAVVNQVLRLDGVVDEPQRIGRQPGLAVDVEPFEIIPFGFAVHLSGPS